MDYSSIVQPRITVLQEEQIQRVHNYSLQILAETGIRVDSLRALNIFKKAEGVKVNGANVRILPDLVEWAISTTPKRVNIYSRKKEFAFCVGEDKTRFGIGVTNLFYQDPESDDLTPFMRKHMGIGARLGEKLDAYDLVSTLGVIRDVPIQHADLLATLEMAANTYKPLILLISDQSQFVPVLDLLENLLGDISENPWIIPYVNPVTPLVINQDTGDKILVSIERGLPIIFSNYGMAGATTPINAAGMLALLNAELLSGLVLTQLAKPGSAVILGSLPAYFDMKVMIDFYDPKSILINSAFAEMMAFYQVPHAGTSGSGYGWGMDLPAAGIMWLNHLCACLGKTGLAPFVGGSLSSKALSPKNIVYSSDIIQQARQFSEGFILDDFSVGLEEIASTGPGGNFLTAKSTQKCYKDAYFESQIFPRYSLEKWQEKFQPKAEKFLIDRTRDLIEASHFPDDHDSLIQKGETIIQKSN